MPAQGPAHGPGVAQAQVAAVESVPPSRRGPTVPPAVSSGTLTQCSRASMRRWCVFTVAASASRIRRWSRRPRTAPTAVVGQPDEPAAREDGGAPRRRPVEAGRFVSIDEHHPAAQLPARPMLTSPSGPVRVSRASGA